MTAFLALLLAMLLIGPEAVYATAANEGGTKAYELEGEWKEQPEEVTSGLDVLSMVWWLDINDSAPAPGNEPTTDNLLTVTVENARFGEVPAQCLSGTAGNSELSDDKRTLTCDIGERDEGTAQMVLSGIEVDGPARAEVAAKATFRGLEAELPKIPITAPFLMDAKFNRGAPTSLTGVPDTQQFLSFPFSLTHSSGSAPGPDSVEYEITINGVKNERITTQDVACAPIDRVHPGYPYSAAGFPAEQTTSFPACEFTLVDADTNTFKLKLSGLDYESARPQLDTNGVKLPQVQPNYPREVIAAGELRVQVPYDSGYGSGHNQRTNVTLKASAPTYTAADGSTAEDDPSNNENRAPIIRGNWTGAWIVSSQQPKAYPGIGWSDTSRAPVGATVMSVSGLAPPRTTTLPDSWLCNNIDTERVDFVDARVVGDSSVPNVYYGEHIDDIKILYYTGEVADPNLFECGTKETRYDEGQDEKDGWSYTKPANPADVKAVKIRLPRNKGHLSSLPASYFYLVVEQKIRDDVEIGADVWTFTSVLDEGATEWDMDINVKRRHHRITDEEVWTEQQAAPGVLVEGVRYPTAGPGRDLLRTVASMPVITKDVAQPEYGPGEEAEYTLRYGLESEIPNMPKDTVVVKDKLAKGMEYVAGSAVVEPEITEEDGHQVLTWTTADVEPELRVTDEKAKFIHYRATLPQDAQAGDVFTNEVSATSQGVTRKAEARVTVPEAGYTTLKKSVDTAVIETLDNGVATAEWEIELGSKDPGTSTITDVIDVLPFNGDDKGSKFTGSLKVVEVTGAEGATVYSTDADPATIDEDPNAAVNGETGESSAMWTEGVKDNATAVRVITKSPLQYGDAQKITVKTELHGAQSGDVVVNKAVGRAENTKMRMRTSAQFIVLTPVDVTVEKVWKDESGDELTDTPESVTVQLVRTQGDTSENVGDKVQLSAENNWKHVFEQLPTAVDGKAVTYSVVEDEVAGFASEVTSENKDGNYHFVVTNTRVPEPGPEPEPEDPKQPQLPVTGVDYSAVMLLAAGAAAAGAWLVHRSRRRSQ